MCSEENKRFDDASLSKQVINWAHFEIKCFGNDFSCPDAGSLFPLEIQRDRCGLSDFIFSYLFPGNASGRA